MADYNPPIENLPIFDPLMFKQGDSYITQNEGDKRYLRYPNAQGTENLQAINVNGVATFNTIVKSKEQLQLLDTTASGTTTECLIGANSNNNNRFALVMNPGSGAYNGLTVPNDVLLVSGDVGGVSANQPLTLTTWSNTSNGLRISDTEVKLGCGGTSQNPTNRITFTPSSSNIYGSLNVYNNLLMNASLATDRQISTGYINLNPIGSAPGATGTQIYQSAGASYWDNNVNGGSITFATNTSGGVQVLPFQIFPTNNQSNVSLLINGVGNYLQFPDGTQQTTAASASVQTTKTIVYTSNISVVVPSGCKFIDVFVVGRGGNCGNPEVGPPILNYGGTGSGGNAIWASGIPMNAGETLDLSFSNTSTTGFSQILYLGAVFAKAFNGNDGGPGAGTPSGGTSNTANPSVGNTSYSVWNTAFGNAGVNGGGPTIPTMTTNASCPRGTSIWGVKNGCGQRSTDNATPSGCIVITYHG